MIDGSEQHRQQAATIMFQGTASDVGKSLLATALCRILARKGHRVAPFKSQNMSLNSYITRDGKEIGQAQGMQADACGIEATTWMNPILLKPTKEMSAQVIVHGEPYKDLSARAYRENYLPYAERIVKEALEQLRADYDVVVIEGAGSPAEINLKDRDIVNMRLAEWADAPVILVADIDRGGVFASVVGTLSILEPHERERVHGVIINKFRGDVTLLEPGVAWLEERIGKSVLGVVPFLDGLALEQEDSASLSSISPKPQAPLSQKTSSHHKAPLTDEMVMNRSKGIDQHLDIAMIRIPRVSNFHYMDPLAHESDVRLRWIDSAHTLGNPHVVIVPESNNPEEAGQWLRATGLTACLQAYTAQGGLVYHIDQKLSGQGGHILDAQLDLADDQRRRAWLNTVREHHMLPAHRGTLDYVALREQSFERLADHFERYVDMEQIYTLLGR